VTKTSSTIIELNSTKSEEFNYISYLEKLGTKEAPRLGGFTTTVKGNHTGKQ